MDEVLADGIGGDLGDGGDAEGGEEGIEFIEFVGVIFDGVVREMASLAVGDEGEDFEGDQLVVWKVHFMLLGVKICRIWWIMRQKTGYKADMGGCGGRRGWIYGGIDISDPCRTRTCNQLIKSRGKWDGFFKAFLSHITLFFGLYDIFWKLFLGESVGFLGWTKVCPCATSFF